MRRTTGESVLENLPKISAAKLSAVLIDIADHAPMVLSEGPTTSYTFLRGEAKMLLAVNCASEGKERLTRGVLVLGTDDSSAALAAMLGFPCPKTRTTFEFCDLEGERLDVYAPRLSSIEDSATISQFLRLPLAA